MGYSKRQFINEAFDDLGLASYAYSLPPDAIEKAVWKLDSMMATWNYLGIRLGYPIPGSPQFSDIDAPSNVPDSANEAIRANLAIRLAPSYGKAVSPDTKATARAGYQVLLNIAAVPPEMHLPAMMPAGAGNKYWRNNGPFWYGKDNAVQVGPDGNLELE